MDRRESPIGLAARDGGTDGGNDDGFGHVHSSNDAKVPSSKIQVPSESVLGTRNLELGTGL
jgi:hypothetical protein